jgi:hypothetical protein
LFQVTIEQLGDFARGAWFPNFVQRSRDMLAETTTRIRNLLHWRRRILQEAAIHIPTFDLSITPVEHLCLRNADALNERREFQ